MPVSSAHFVERMLEVPAYVRYVDDLFLFGDHRADSRRWRATLGAWLRDERTPDPLRTLRTLRTLR